MPPSPAKLRPRRCRPAKRSNPALTALADTPVLLSPRLGSAPLLLQGDSSSNSGYT